MNDYFLQKNYLMASFHTVVIGPGEKEQAMHTDDGLIALPRPRPLIGTVSSILHEKLLLRDRFADDVVV